MRKLILIQGHDRSGKTTLALGLKAKLKEMDVTNTLVISRHYRNRYLLQTDEALRGINVLIVDGVENIKEKKIVWNLLNTLFESCDNAIFDVCNEYVLEHFNKSNSRLLVPGICILGVPIENVQVPDLRFDAYTSLPFVETALSHIME